MDQRALASHASAQGGKWEGMNRPTDAEYTQMAADYASNPLRSEEVVGPIERPTEKDYTEWAEAFETGAYRATPVEEPQINSRETTLSAFAEHDVIVLTRDLPDLGLRAGAVGAVVGIYASGGYEVEFTTTTGRTLTVVPLSGHDFKPVPIPPERS